jgi:alkanesulfonate monooxygenase SsuD/methylene tetrahydromethanopterin reductase-like flavin-dependent oxidoreductase (luciferase family)
MVTDRTPAISAPQVGCVYRPQFPPEHLAAGAQAADAAGVDELWLWEDCFLTGGVSTAAIALSHSTRLKVGIGVLPTPMRNVATTAMEIATLDRAFPGRLRVGVGHGVQDWMGQIGGRVGSPMTLLREYLTCLAGLLHGERLTHDGRYIRLEEVALDWLPDTRIELLVGATGPKTLRLSGLLAAGTVIGGGTTPQALKAAVDHIHDGARHLSTPSHHSVVVYLICATGRDARRAARDEATRWGYDPDDDVSVHGDGAEVASAIRRWTEAGATSVVLQPTADADFRRFATFVGAEVIPLVRTCSG